mgnify:CR=1 FL=1
MAPWGLARQHGLFRALYSPSGHEEPAFASHRWSDGHSVGTHGSVQLRQSAIGTPCWLLDTRLISGSRRKL